MKANKYLLLLSMILLLLMLAACGSTGNTETDENGGQDMAQAQSADGTLTLGMLADPDTLNPLATTDGNAGCWFAAMVYPTLLRQDENAEVEPYIATDYGVSEDGMVVTFTLREDLQWADGTPFTSADVAYTKYLAGDLGISPTTASALDLVESVETPDDYTVIFHLSQPSYSFVTSIGVRLYILPKHIWENVEDPANFLNNTNQVGMGPYKLAEYTEGEYYIYEAVENWLDAPNGIQAKKLVFRIYPDVNTMALALQNGEIDITARDLSYDLIEQLRGKGYEIAETNSLGFTHIGFNLENEFINDLAVRQAVAMAIDKDTVLQFAVKGQGEVMDSIVSPAFSGLQTDDAENLYPAYDVEGAKAVLAEAGYSDTDGDGILNAANGENLSFNMIVISNDVALTNGAEVIKQCLKDVGIDLEVMLLERTTFIQRRLDIDFDSYLASWGTMEPMMGDFIVNYLSSSPVYFNGVKCDATEEAVLAMQSAVNEEELVAGIHAFEKAMAQDIINVPLYMQKLSYAYNGEAVSNVQAYPSAMHGVTTPEALVNMTLGE